MSFPVDLGYLALLGAVTLRFSVLAALLPVLSFRSVPLLWRLALAVVLALAVTPAVAAELAPRALALGWPALVLEAARSLMVGALLAVAVDIPFEAVRYAGNIAGMQVGFAIVNTVDPQTGTQVSVLDQVYHLLAMLLFFVLDGHLMVVRALVGTLEAVPPFAAPSAAAGSWLVVGAFGSVFAHGLQIAAPVVVVLLLESAAMGVIVRTAPQVNVLVVGFPLRIAVGLFVLGVSLTFFRDAFSSLLSGLESGLGRLLAVLA